MPGNAARGSPPPQQRRNESAAISAARDIQPFPIVNRVNEPQTTGVIAPHIVTSVRCGQTVSRPIQVLNHLILGNRGGAAGASWISPPAGLNDRTIGPVASSRVRRNRSTSSRMLLRPVGSQGSVPGRRGGRNGSSGAAPFSVASSTHLDRAFHHDRRSTVPAQRRSPGWRAMDERTSLGIEVAFPRRFWSTSRSGA